MKAELKTLGSSALRHAIYEDEVCTSYRGLGYELHGPLAK